jgi:hypothetical protein
MIDNLTGNGWATVEPPEPNDEPSVIARYKGEPIKGGVLMETIEDSPDLIHSRYRTGPYNIDVKVDFEIGRGQARIEKVDSYVDE